MSSKEIILIVAMVCLALVNIAALGFLSIFGLFVTAASVPFAMRILDVIEKMP